MIARPGRIGAALPAACALALACALHLLCVLRAPAVFAPSRIDVRLAPGQTLVLGRAELAAPQADSAQLALRRDASGRWWLRNAGARAAGIERGASERRTGTVAPGAGLRFQLGASVFAVDAASARTVAFSDGTHRWRYDGAILTRDGAVLPPCPDASLASRAAAAWNRRVPAWLARSRPLHFGGNLTCGNRIGIAGVAPAGAAIARSRDGLLLSAATGPGRAPLMVAGGAVPLDLAQREEALDGVSALVVGRTRLMVSAEGDVLSLRPASHVALSTMRDVRLPPQVAWRWSVRDPWSLPAPAAWLAALAAGLLSAGALFLTGRRDSPAKVRAHRAGGAVLAALGLAALLVQRAATAPGFGLSMLLAWAALWFMLLAPGRLSLHTIAAVLLLATGLLFQLELGLGAMESSWLRHFQKTAALLAIGAGAAACLRVPGLRLAQAAHERILLALAGLALAALLLQVAFGDETGVFGLQPVEFAKLALVALTAHCIAVGLGTGAAGSTLARWLRMTAPALLFLGLLGLALVQVDDYSPLVLLLVWGGAMLFAWALATRSRVAAGALAGMACLAVLGVAALRSAGAAEVSQWSFYADRFMVWLDPLTHPHTGQQLMLAARAIAQGSWHGAGGFFGLASLGQQAGDVLAIPEIEDDFAPAFFLNRHGLAAALALWTLQAMFVASLARTAVRCWCASLRARDFRQAWLARFRCFALCGGGAFVFGHLLLSWGTNLAIFPVMGQPMSFLSAGGSHLLFFICPLLAVGSASVQSLEENESCRSTSNMKS